MKDETVLYIEDESSLYIEDVQTNEGRFFLKPLSRCPYCDGEAVIRLGDVNPYVDVLHKKRFFRECKGIDFSTWEMQELDINRQIEISNQRMRKARLKIVNEKNWKNGFQRMEAL